jgi:hypothetical protein
MVKKKPVILTTNDIIEANSKLKPRLKLMIKKLDRNTVLIEGSPKALEFLGRFILAHSQAHPDDCTIGLSPRGAGSSWFTKESTLGFYLHRFPCNRGKLLAKSGKGSHQVAKASE